MKNGAIVSISGLKVGNLYRIAIPGKTCAADVFSTDCTVNRDVGVNGYSYLGSVDLKNPFVFLGMLGDHGLSETNAVIMMAVTGLKGWTSLFRDDLFEEVV